jgi:hypothetical protein
MIVAKEDVYEDSRGSRPVSAGTVSRWERQLNETDMDSNQDDLSPNPTLRQRGRRSAASLAAVPIDARARRPERPERLTAAEKAIWREITEKVRGGWFYSSEHLLEAYVCTLGQWQQLQGCLQQVEPGSERYIELMRLQLSVTTLAGNLATKLRLTPRSTVDRYTPKVVPSSPRPWQDDPPAA